MNTDQSVEQRTWPPRAAQRQLNTTGLSSSVPDLEQGRAFIRQRPVVSVLAALGAGYLVARLTAVARR